MTIRPLASTFGFLGLVLAAFLPGGAAAQVDDWTKIKTPAITIHRPDPQRFTLPNGMVVFLLENHRLPLVNAQVWVRTGSLYEPEAEAGVAEVMGTMLRMGGTKSMKPDDLDEALDLLAADVRTSIGNDSGIANLNVPSSSFKKALPLFADVLMNPAFDAAKFDVAKGQMKEQIRRQNDDPIQIAVREYSKLLFGEHHPAGRSPTFETVDHLTREHLVAFHQRYFHPNNAMIAISGDFDGSKIKSQLKSAFGSWPKAKVEFPPIPEPKPMSATNLHLARKPVASSVILAGHLGTTVHDPKHVSVEMMNDILGGQGFSSRITQTIRNDRGLAYFAGSFYQLGTVEPGVFIGISMTQADSTTVALDLLLKEIEKIRESAVTSQELESARNYRLNSEVFEYDSPEEIANRVLYLEYNGLPKDFLQKGLDEVSAMTSDQLLQAAKTYLHPDQMTILVVGDDAKFSAPLSTFGAKVDEIELTDPTKKGS